MEQKYPTSLYRSMMSEGELTDEEYAECGYNKNSTLGDILININKKLNAVENRVFLALVGGGLNRFNKRTESEKVLYWRKRYLGAKSRYEKMKAEKDYWRERWQKDREV